jgi:hypothetical protein
MTFRCATCGKEHEDLPDLGVDKPDPWWDVPEDKRDGCIELTSDTCIIENEHFFIRGVIEIPILDHSESFGFGVWVSQKKENFYTYVEHFDSKDIGPFFGWLSTRLGYFEKDTFLLKTMAHFRGNGLRPRIEVEPTEHPLALAQLKGITYEEALRIVRYYKDEHGA